MHACLTKRNEIIEETENAPSTHSFFQHVIILKPSIKLVICL